jgi:hypothetical protein
MQLTKIVPFVTVLVLTMLISLPSWAGTQLWDFEKGDDGWEVANGKWEAKGGIYQVAQGGVAEHALIGEDKWDDYTVEAKIRIDANNWAGLIFRAQSEQEYYIYYLNVPSNKSELWQHNKGAWDTRVAINSNIPAVGKVVIKNNEWYDVKVIVEGKTTQLFINGELQTDKLEAPAYKTGKIGVWAWESGASFDDVTITGDDVIDTLDVEAHGKLATKWARIKRGD